MDILVTKLIELSSKYGRDIFLDETKISEELMTYFLVAKQEEQMFKRGLNMNLYFKFLYATDIEDIKYFRIKTIKKLIEEERYSENDAKYIIDCWIKVIENDRNISILETITPTQENLYTILYEIEKNYLNKKFDKVLILCGQLPAHRLGVVNYWLGTCYAEGSGTVKQFSKSLEYFAVGANLNDANCLYRIGCAYFDGIGIQQDFDIAFEYFKNAGAKGHDKALFRLGLIYKEGFGNIKANYIKMMESFIKSAHQGNVMAGLLLAATYYNDANKPDYKKALDWYLRLTSKDCDEAYMRASEMYEKGIGVQEDKAKANELFEKAESLGNGKARVRMILNSPNNMLINDKMLSTSEAVKSNFAVEVAMKTAKTGDSNAQLALGVLYLEGKGVAQSFTKALSLFQSAEKSGNVNAKKLIAVAYFQLARSFIGYGDVKNYSKSIDYLYSALEYKDHMGDNEVAECYMLLAECFMGGKGITKDFDKAVTNYLVAAKLGDSEAYIQLAKSYEDASSPNLSYEKALEYYIKYYKAGYESILSKVVEIYNKHRKQNKGKSKLTIQTLFDLAAMNLSTAQYELGLLYEVGDTVQKNSILAEDWFRKAAEQGHSKAYDKIINEYDR